MERMLTRFQGSVLVLFTGAIFSVGPLTFRAVLEADAWQYLFYRGFSAAVVVVLTIMVIGRNPVRSIVDGGFRQAAAGLLLGALFVLFIVALSRTTAAFVLLLQCTSPFFAALLGRVFLREPVGRDTVISMLVAFVGVSVMVGTNFESGDRVGTILSLLLPVFLGGYSVLVRSSPARDPGVPFIIGGLAVAVVAGVVSWGGPGLNLPLRDVAMGCIGGGALLGLAGPLFNYAHRFVPPADTSLLLISEIILAPLWLWIWPGEVPSAGTLIGGGMSLSAVVWLTACAGGRSEPTGRPRVRGLHAGAVPTGSSNPDQ